ncbi:MAG: hypothetical protein AB2810_14285 [Candidatus Thiodiazotropha endolucinida]
MKQQILQVIGFEKHQKTTRKVQFLDEMEQIIPWEEICKVIAHNYLNPLKSQESPLDWS